MVFWALFNNGHFFNVLIVVATCGYLQTLDTEKVIILISYNDVGIKCSNLCGSFQEKHFV